MDIEVERGELTHWRVTEPGRRPLADGEARLCVDRFGFSSNNVSYAVIGDLLRYWEAFPASPADPGDGTVWGRVPVWGFADVVESRSPDVVVGERLFGFLPMSTELVIEPGRSTPGEVCDVAAHRSVLAGPYNAYRRCAVDPAYRPDGEELQMLLYPLFFTSFVIDDFVADHDDFGAAQVVLSSASAKTALGPRTSCTPGASARSASRRRPMSASVATSGCTTTCVPTTTWRPSTGSRRCSSTSRATRAWCPPSTAGWGTVSPTP